MSDIFISYARPDRAKAELLAKALEHAGWSVWWDAKIPPGRTFDEVIEEVLRATRCVVVLWSRKSVKSDWVREEASEGKRRRILVPAFIQNNVKPPFGFRLLEAADLSNWKGETSGHAEFEELKKAVAVASGEKEGRKEAAAEAEVHDFTIQFRSNSSRSYERTSPGGQENHGKQEEDSAIT